MSVRMRHTRAHTKNRRSHHALSEARLSACSNCGEAHLRHKMCDNCGTYRGREVVDVASQIARKEKRRKEKLKSLGQETNPEEKKEEAGSPASGGEKTLNVEALSKK